MELFFYQLCCVLLVVSASAMEETITIKQMSDGCCGQQQKVICNVTGFRIIVMAGNMEQVFTFDTRDTIFDMNGFEIRVIDAMPHPTIDFNFIFIAQILYITDAMTSNLTISCGNVVSVKSITIPVNSTPCIYHAFDTLNSRTTLSQNDDDTFNLTISLGTPVENTVLFQQCNVTLQFKNSSIPKSRNTTLQLLPDCTSDGQYSNILAGVYTISGNISTECGELIVVGPVSVYLGPTSTVGLTSTLGPTSTVGPTSMVGPTSTVGPGSGNSSGSVSSILGVFATTMILALLS